MAYAGRAIGQAEPRYKFPTGFRKSLELFNLHRAVRSGGRQVVVVEGFFDCMRVHQAGFRSVVALMGSALSATQQELLLGHFGELVLMMDGDETGRRASQRIAAQLGNRIPVRVVEVPAGRQPDQLNATEIRRLLETDGADAQILGAEHKARTATVEAAYEWFERKDRRPSARWSIQPPPRGAGEFSTGEMGNFQPALTDVHVAAQEGVPTYPGSGARRGAIVSK